MDVSPMCVCVCVVLSTTFFYSVITHSAIIGCDTEHIIPYRLVVMIPGFQPGALGSIPGMGVSLLFSEKQTGKLLNSPDNVYHCEQDP